VFPRDLTPLEINGSERRHNKKVSLIEIWHNRLTVWILRARDP
jgi:hypothetical protein